MTFGKYIKLGLQSLRQAAAVACEYRGCHLGDDNDLGLFSDGQSFVIVPMPDQRECVSARSPHNLKTIESLKIFAAERSVPSAVDTPD
jgi:hypothetical protein